MSWSDTTFLGCTNGQAPRPTNEDQQQHQIHPDQTVLQWQKCLQLAQKAGLRIGLWDWDIPSDMLTWSAQAYLSSGDIPDIFRGKASEFLKTIHPDDRLNIEKGLQRVVAGDTEYEAQFRVVRPDGSICWLDFRGLVIQQESAPRMLGVAIDITDLKNAQALLQESEEKYRLLLNSTAEGICGLDVLGNCTFCNPSAARMFGYSDPAELLDKPVHLLHHHTYANGDPYRVEECKIYQALRRGEKTHLDNEVFFRVDGTSFPVEFWSHPIRRDGEVVGSVVTFLDISGRKLAENSLRRSEANYRSIVESAPYGMYRSTLDGRFLMVNPALVRMLGYDSEHELLSLDIAKDVYCRPRQLAEFVARVVADGRLIKANADWKRKDGGRITVVISAVPVHNDSGELEAFQVVVEDVTEHKVLEKQFWQAQKMEAIGRLAGGVAHDFNNFLMIIGSYAELIATAAHADEKTLRYVESIQRAASKAASVTRQLLAFSRKQVFEIEVLNLNNVLTDFVKILPRLLGENITVSTSFDPQLGQVRIDRGQMEQVIMNLAVNSRDAMPKGGRFTIETANAEVDKSYVSRHPAMRPGNYVLLAVSDTGTGMDAKTKSQLFEPFFTTKERGRGTGLGLAAVYGIVKQSGGFIWVYSELGRGTTFKIHLPRIDEPAVTASGTSEMDPLAAGSETVLVVEDEEEVRTATREFLKSKGYTVLEAGNGAEALRICDQHDGTIDAVITDLVMPGIDGIEMTQAMASVRPGMRVLYMSGYTDGFVTGLPPGAVLLQKPFNLDTLIRKLRAVLDRPPNP
ncbi:MAG: PAS domain S-box protein [Terriglobales bacterium]